MGGHVSSVGGHVCMSTLHEVCMYIPYSGWRGMCKVLFHIMDIISRLQDAAKVSPMQIEFPKSGRTFRLHLSGDRTDSPERSWLENKSWRWLLDTDSQSKYYGTRRRDTLISSSCGPRLPYTYLSQDGHRSKCLLPCLIIRHSVCAVATIDPSRKSDD